MKFENANLPIYPSEREISGGGTMQTFGLTKREHFAAMAMQGIMSSNECGIGHDPNTVAEWAVSLADALLEELEKTKDL